MPDVRPLVPNGPHTRRKRPYPKGSSVAPRARSRRRAMDGQGPSVRPHQFTTVCESRGISTLPKPHADGSNACRGAAESPLPAQRALPALTTELELVLARLLRDHDRDRRPVPPTKRVSTVAVPPFSVTSMTLSVRPSPDATIRTSGSERGVRTSPIASAVSPIAVTTRSSRGGSEAT